MKVAHQKQSKYYVEVTPITRLLLISAHIFDPLQKLRSFRKWDKAMNMNPENEMSNTTKSQDVVLKYVENEYCTKHRRTSITKPENDQHHNFFPSAKHSGFGRSSFDPYDLSSNDDKYFKPKCVAELTPGRSNCAARLLTAARFYLHSPPQSAKNWGQVNRNVNEYHSDPMDISSTSW